ncbi:MAG TPA: peptidoglycan DD-metalloendopeptidase family protein [Flavobacteriaceae bacterium]
MASAQFSAFLNQISSKPLHVLDSNIPHQAYIPLNLSKTNQGLNSVNTSSSKDLETYIFGYIKSNNAKVAFGGYNEVRNIYQRSVHFNQSNPETERNIHLGMDLWIEARSPVFTPLDATVHSFKNNTNDGDYGPTIILEHRIEGVKFHTLYGHLSLESITQLNVGQTFKQGEQIATLGDANVNGDYPPHLHFQIIRDIEDYKGDYPGVCSKQDLTFYLNNCPDPNVLLKLG